jgi:PAP2 superfamily
LSGLLRRAPNKVNNPGKKRIMRQKTWAYAATLLLCCCLWDCSRRQGALPPAERQALDVVVAWNRLLLELERYTPGYRAPVSARMFAYVSAAAYQAGLPVSDHYISLETQWKSLAKMDLPHWKSGVYVLPAGLNSAYSVIVEKFFPTAPTELLARAHALQADFKQKIGTSADPASCETSEVFGRQTAEAIWRWSETDSVGHDGFLYNYDRNYAPPACAGCWQPGGNRAMPALLPQWADARPFRVALSEISARPPLPYAETPGSDFYKQAMEVFAASRPVTKESRWVAEFWSDDLDGLTLSPAGRWMSIATQAIEKEKASTGFALETYLRTAIALCDAGILCWGLKYRYRLERPETYIRRMIEPGWEPLHGTPAFPAYPSGHSTFGAAAAAVLTAQFGERFGLVDRTHEGRREFESAPRAFESFEVMARENAFSRIAMGVHFRMDCEEGLRIGKIVGQKIADWQLRHTGKGDVGERVDFNAILR